MLAGSIAISAPSITHLVSTTSVPFLSIEYRLAPEVRAPKPLQDCYPGLQYLFTHAQTLNIDPTRIGLMGESAGGGLAACLAHYAKENRGPGIAKRILIYPMLNDRTTTPDSNIKPYALWSYEANATGRRALLGDDVAGGDDAPVIHAARRMPVEQTEGLPPAYIEVGQLDGFRDEDLEYARVLGVEMDFHLWLGMPHAFESLAPEGEVAGLARGFRARAMGSL